MNWLDTKYCTLLSNKLERFKRVENKYNFRCPICGDSKKSRSKARGWLSERNNKTRFRCYNCGTSLSLGDFIKKIDVSLYYEYIKDIMIEKSGPQPTLPKTNLIKNMKTPTFIKESPLKSIKKISQLEPDHPAKIYLMKRLIPTKYHSKLFYAPRFKKFINTLIPDKFPNIDKDEPRLIIPLLDENKNLLGVQGRSFKKNDDLKYITILLNENNPKIFGLDEVDFKKRVYVFEGPIDAMFIPNSLASCGGKISSTLWPIQNKLKDAVIVYDNEPRSIDTIKKIESTILDGYSVCIWPEDLIYKDINDMIISGMSPNTIISIMEKNTYSGLSAKLKIIQWRKYENI